MGERDPARALDSALRALPSVQSLAERLEPGTPGPLSVGVARDVITQRRAELTAGGHGPQGPDAMPRDGDLLQRAQAALAVARRPSLRRVINATGVIIHTNLGRAPLAACAHAAVLSGGDGYCNLELDLNSGRRGSRQDHVETLLCELTGAPAALVVNNGAAAVLLAVAALAGPGSGVAVSRGQLIEIGGSFRIPEVIEASGTRLIEVGTTNRTRLDDYRAALADPDRGPVGAILRAHPSNFRSVGFVQAVDIEDLCTLGVAVIDDLGSGVLTAGIPECGDEPDVRRSVSAGAALVCFSGDKLLGGPQAGLLVGQSDAVRRARNHPLARALRIDRLSLAALEATLRLHREPERARREIPVLAMIGTSRETLQARAARLLAGLESAGVDCVLVQSTARVGGGALPLQELRGPAVALSAPAGADRLAADLRGGDPPVIARISAQQVLLDPRTLTDADVPVVVDAVSRTLAG